MDLLADIDRRWGLRMQKFRSAVRLGTEARLQDLKAAGVPACRSACRPLTRRRSNFWAAHSPTRPKMHSCRARYDRLSLDLIYARPDQLELGAGTGTCAGVGAPHVALPVDD